MVSEFKSSSWKRLRATLGTPNAVTSQPIKTFYWLKPMSGVPSLVNTPQQCICQSRPSLYFPQPPKNAIRSHIKEWFCWLGESLYNPLSSPTRGRPWAAVGTFHIQTTIQIQHSVCSFSSIVSYKSPIWFLLQLCLIFSKKKHIGFFSGSTCSPVRVVQKDEPWFLCMVDKHLPLSYTLSPLDLITLLV